MELKGLNENIQDKKEKLEHSRTCPNLPKPEGLQRNSPKQAQSRPDEPNLVQARSLQKSWVFSHPTCPDESNHTQARSHLA